MNILRIIFNVCERLFEELVKELLKDRFTVVSGSFREIDGGLLSYQPRADTITQHPS